MGFDLIRLTLLTDFVTHTCLMIATLVKTKIVQTNDPIGINTYIYSVSTRSNIFLLFLRCWRSRDIIPYFLRLLNPFNFLYLAISKWFSNPSFKISSFSLSIIFHNFDFRKKSKHSPLILREPHKNEKTFLTMELSYPEKREKS